MRRRYDATKASRLLNSRATDAHQRPTCFRCSTAAVKTTRPLDSHTPAPAPRGCHSSRCALDEGSLRGATSEEKTRYDEAADPRPEEHDKAFDNDGDVLPRRPPDECPRWSRSTHGFFLLSFLLQGSHPFLGRPFFLSTCLALRRAPRPPACTHVF